MRTRHGPRAVVAAIGLVMLVCSAGLLWLEKTYLHAHAIAAAQSVADEVDAEVAATLASLRNLARSSSLANHDLANFYQEAQIGIRGLIVNNVVLMSRDGQQHLNTLRILGGPLPEKGNPPVLMKMFDDRTPVVTDLFKGPLTGTYLVAVGVPVVLNGEVAYVLGSGMSPDRLASLIDRGRLPEDNMVSIIDGQGVIVAQTQDALRDVGQQAPQPLRQAMTANTTGMVTFTDEREHASTLSAFVHTRYTPWCVAVSIPQSVVFAPLYRTVGVLAVLGSMALLWAVVWVRRVERAASGPI